ncbi:reverse transcriptase domain-containing protein [Tanacetum coccineum]|uniref:Reverse transcriptase domain-containing protein n=1 Tax=Tanacetum coccineum TaxID=301880 RepID=A0ABQ5BNK4_9ASTR
MEEMLAKFIDEGKREHKDMEIFINEFTTTNELLLKERSNLLNELKIEVIELSKVMSNVLIPKNKVNGVTTRGGKMTSKAAPSKEINETRINKNEPPRFEQDVQEKPHDVGGKNKSSSIRERTTQPLVKPQQSSIPFPNNHLYRSQNKSSSIHERTTQPLVKPLQQKFLEILKQLDINILFIESLVQIPKYAKYLKSLLANKSRHEEACTKTMNERCSAVLLNELPLKEKDPMSFTIPYQVLEKHKEAKDLAADHLSVFENPHMEVLTEREIADKFSNEHLMVLKSKFNNDEPWFGVPKALISDRGTYFCKYQLEKALQRYGVTHKLSMTYHPQSNGQTEVTNRAIKRILERSVGYNPKDWSEKLNDALWAFRTAYKTLTSHLMQLNELAKLRDGAYENTIIYKEGTKKWHDSRLRGDKYFKVGEKVLLYNSRLKMYPGKLMSKWSGPNIVKTVYPYGAVEIIDKNGCNFKVNGQRFKKYYEGDIDKKDDEVIEFENGVTTQYGDLARKKSTMLVKYLQSGILAHEINNGESIEQNIKGVSRSNALIMLNYVNYA